MNRTVKIFSSILIVVLLANTIILPGANPSRKKTEFKQLAKILGEKVIICTGANKNKYFVSSFTRLSEEQDQHLKKSDDIKKNSTDSANNDKDHEKSFYITLNLKSISGVFAENDFYTENSHQLLKHSQAPPSIS